MATATETTTTDHLASHHQQQPAAESGALVHKPTEDQQVARQSTAVSHQTRPQSAVYSSVGGGGDNDDGDDPHARPGEMKTQKFLPWYTRWGYNISLGAAQGFLKPASFIRDTQDAIRSPLHNPNMVKHYECRKTLPIR